MIHFEKRTLDNGLVVIIHQDPNATMSAVNMLYKVGSKNELDGKTGLAHLFEHLMFEGDQYGDRFDKILQHAGGDNNAFTSSDITNYYNVIPPDNIDTALFLESGRMMNLNLSDQNIQTQLQVVIEEFKETCLNVPYGDAWHEISKMSYSQHAYKWPVIGRSIDELMALNPEDFRSFYEQYYKPSNAILVISGPIEYSKTWERVDHWFAEKPMLPILKNIPVPEPNKTQPKVVHVENDVPMDSLWIAFPMCGRSDAQYYTNDIISDILGTGRSSRLYESLVKRQRLALSADCFITGTIDPGLLIIEAKPFPGVSLTALEKAIWKELNHLKSSPPDEQEISKYITRIESELQFGEADSLRKAMTLAYFEVLGDVHQYAEELTNYNLVNPQSLLNTIDDTLDPMKSSTLFYKSNAN